MFIISWIFLKNTDRIKCWLQWSVDSLTVLPYEASLFGYIWLPDECRGYR